MADFDLCLRSAGNQHRHLVAKTYFKTGIGVDIDFDKRQTESAQGIRHILTEMAVASPIKRQDRHYPAREQRAGGVAPPVTVDRRKRWTLAR